MRKVSVFNHVSIDGYFTDNKNDMSFAHRNDANDDPEWRKFTEESAGAGGTLVFGRVTYEMMASYWPTAKAKQDMPAVAERMNGSPKIVFSKSLKNADWTNTTLIHDDPASSIKRLKNDAGPDMVILGSGTIVTQLAAAGLIDEYRLVVNPIVLGQGRTLFESVKDKVALARTDSRTFKNGNVLLTYRPAEPRR